jgi:hypothetical protein
MNSDKDRKNNGQVLSGRKMCANATAAGASNASTARDGRKAFLTVLSNLSYVCAPLMYAIVRKRVNFCIGAN